jgi:hypothetical protein
MAIAADAITLRKLALAKRLYQHAITQASHHTLTARILAVIAFDLATETLLRTIVSALEASRTAADGFAGLMQQVEALLSAAALGSLPDRANVHYVHLLRDDAQHRAKHPSETEVSDARTYTRDFLNKTTRLVWGLNIDAISLVDLIQHSRLREFLKDAERAFEAQDFDRVAAQAAAAVSLAYESVQKAFVGRLPGYAGGFSMKDAWGRPGSDRDAREVLRAFERMQETVLTLGLGLNYGDHVRFRQLAGDVDFMLNGEVQPHGAKQDLSAGESEFVLAYATDAVQQIEARVGDIENPFGSKDW